MTKRAFDILFAGIGLIVCSPLLLLIALSIKLWSSSGPVLYRSRRVGQWGKPFWCLKFRTMVVNAESLGGPSAADDDPRITQIGRYLRKYKLDELPQLINVFRGEMSFVGPRPEVPQYAALFTEGEKLILSVPPGITDLATLWNSDEGAALAGSKDPERDYLERIRPRKIALQLEYARRHSFGTDLVILFRTLAAILRRPTHQTITSSSRSPRVLGNELE